MGFDFFDCCLILLFGLVFVAVLLDSSCWRIIYDLDS